MARIYPLWILFLVLEMIISKLFGNTYYGSWQFLTTQNEQVHTLYTNSTVIVLLALTFLPWISNHIWNVVIPGGWSIQVEVAHYLLFPFIKKSNFWKCIILAYIAFDCAYLIRNTLPADSLPQLILSAFIRFDVFSTFIFFLIGVYAFKVWDSSGDTKRSSHTILFPNTAVILTLVFSFMLLPLNFGSKLESLSLVSRTPLP